MRASLTVARKAERTLRVALCRGTVWWCCFGVASHAGVLRRCRTLIALGAFVARMLDGVAH